jgi:hypothetical protein
MGDARGRPRWRSSLVGDTLQSFFHGAPQNRAGPANLSLDTLPGVIDMAPPVSRPRCVLPSATIPRSSALPRSSHLSEWGKVLHDEDLAAAILDRILERGRLIHLDGSSGRTRHLNLEGVLPGAAERARISGTHSARGKHSKGLLKEIQNLRRIVHPPGLRNTRNGRREGNMLHW